MEKCKDIFDTAFNCCLFSLLGDANDVSVSILNDNLIVGKSETNHVLVIVCVIGYTGEMILEREEQIFK